MFRTTTSTASRPRRFAIITMTAVALGTTALGAPPASAEPAPPPGPPCLPIRCAADYLGLPVDHLLVELDEDVRASGGAPVDVLVARIDAVAAVRLAVTGRTNGSTQDAANRFLGDEHDRVRLALTAAGDPPPVLVPG